MRMRRSHQRAMQLSWQRNISNETTMAAQQLRIFDAAKPSADSFMNRCRAWIYWYSSRKSSRCSNATLSDTINRSASPFTAVWLAQLQCGIENTSCWDH